MHGVIFLEFNRFVDATLGADAWKGAIEDAGLSHAVFLPTQLYPDADLLSLVSSICRKSGREACAVLEEFGTYIVPSLASLYAALIDGNWTLLDMLEQTEATIHRVVRIRAAGAAPPQLKARRVAPNEVEILYTSDRKMCAFARGIVRGLSKLYEEPADVTEPDCMHRGSAACRIVVTTRGKS
jgi:predicted hydrocarbon binding protein